MTILAGVLLTSMMVSGSGPMDHLNEKIRESLAGTQGTFAIAFEDLSTGRQLFINERVMFHAASTMKTPVLIELFRQSERGKLNLSDSIVVRNSFRSIVDGSPYALSADDDSDDSLYLRIGTRMPVRELIEHMMTVSSNLATNILIEEVGAKNVTATMRSLGADSIRVLRGVEDIKAYDLGMNNVTTAYDLMVIMKAIATDKAASKASCQEMMSILERQKFNDIIPALLPDDVKVAHKTGSITNVEHDSGIVTLPDGRRYVLVLLSKDLQSNKEGKEALARVSKLVYDAMTQKEH